MRKLICTFLLLMGVGLFLAQPVMALSIGFDPSSQVASAGDHININIVVTELAAGEIIAAFDLEMHYDPNILHATTVAFGSGLNGNIPVWYIEFLTVNNLRLPQEFIINQNTGIANIREDSLRYDDELASIQEILDPFILATVYFDVITTNTSPIDLSLNGINDIIGINSMAFDKASITLGEGNVAPVPEPATLLLFGAGLAGLAGFSRKKFRKR